MTNDDGFLMEVNNKEEQDFFFSHLKPDMKVLEWGSGISSLNIAPKVRELFSIEHNLDWYNKIKPQLAANATLHYVPQNYEIDASYDDGTYANFKDYVEYPANIIVGDGDITKLSELPESNKFDLIFIDGRARVACAYMAASFYLKPEGTILIHDILHPKELYRRREYETVLDFLDRVDGVFAMHSFKVKK